MISKKKRAKAATEPPAAPCWVYFYPSQDTGLGSPVSRSFATHREAVAAATAWLKTAKHKSAEPLREPTVEVVTDGVVTDRLRKQHKRGTIITERVTSPLGLTGHVKPPKLKP